MKLAPIRAAVASLALVTVAGCTTTGIGTGHSATGNIGATFTWTETGASQGRMVAQLSNGQVFQGPMFQITREARVDYGPLWYGWGPGFRWHQPWNSWGWGWRGWGPWGPGPDTITQYTGQVLANLQGPGGFMRCRFTLMRPTSGMAGGGVGRCQLPTGTIINAQFPPR